MPKLTLTYFDFHGGRGEVARLALSIGGLAFEDRRLAPTDWPKLKAQTPYGALPTLECDGQVIAQSNAINRYVGKLAGLYPADPWQAAICDETLDAVEEITVKVGVTMRIADEGEKKARRLELVDGPIPFYLQRLDKRLELQGGEYFADRRLTVADLAAYNWLRHLRSGVLDHIPTDLSDRVAPKLVAHYERVRTHDGVQAYYAKHGVKR